MTYTVHTYGSEVLRKVAQRIEVIDDEIRKLVDDMFVSMVTAEGIGLAAPQIGRSIRLFVIDLTPVDENEYKRVYINPQIVEYAEEQDEYEEGCLSLPTIHEIITRPTRIRIQYQDLEGEEVDEWVEGFLARVIQHEYDHLEGVLFVDHLSKLKRSLLRKTLNKIANGEIEPEKSENFEL